MRADGPTRPTLRGTFGMCASTHWLASAVAMRSLERGGNAADAAVAGGLVLQVVEPHLNGPGGEAPILVHDPREQRTRLVCGQGTAPRVASIERMREIGLTSIPGAGLISAVVPGAFGAWMTLHEQYGRLSLREVMEPCIGYAENGHPLLARAADAIERVADLFRGNWPSSAEIWLPGNAAPGAGARHRNPGLAATYRRILHEAESGATGREAVIRRARDIWYRGFVADDISAFAESQRSADSPRDVALIDGEDLHGWEATVEDPARLVYRGSFEVFKPGFWSQGPVLLQQLGILEQLGVAEVPVGSAEWVHLVVEAGKLAFADREAWYGDDEDAVPDRAELLSGPYSAQRARMIGSQASLDLRPGSLGGRPGIIEGTDISVAVSADSGAHGEPTFADDGSVRGDTCHIDVIDQDGMMISATPSGGWLQSSPAIPGLGFCLSSRGQMFSLMPGRGNSLAPGRRPRTTLSPSLALRDGVPWLAFGTPGGDSQDQWQLQLFLRVADGGADLQEAIDAPAFHSEHAPDSFYPHRARPGVLRIEDRITSRVREDLSRRGHLVNLGDPWSEGRLSAVGRDGEWLRGAANARGAQGYAVGR